MTADSQETNDRFPQLRLDPFTGRTTIVAPSRQQRPQSLNVDQDFDPFLEGHEHETPAEVLAIREPNSQSNGPGWTIRVVPNRYAAVGSFGSDSIEADAAGIEGVHEVVIECPGSETCLSQLSESHVEQLFRVYRDRLKTLSSDERLAAAILFKNKGAAAGASIAHAHSQIIATRFVPNGITNELNRCQSIYENGGSDPFEQLIDEAHDSKRVVSESNGMIAVCPFASRFPFEVWLLPRKHECRFNRASDPIVNQTGRMMRNMVSRLQKLHGDLPYNFVLHANPFQHADVPWYRWHFEIYPRLAGFAGYEAGADCFINPMPPEVAADRLRQA